MINVSGIPCCFLDHLKHNEIERLARIALRKEISLYDIEDILEVKYRGSRRRVLAQLKIFTMEDVARFNELFDNVYGTDVFIDNERLIVI